ncbi:BRE1 E3 ubiquitin ligase-domain-containing protein [Elsinoe ampelina]|uniref:E3 ubiquitin protein ligase n=1 Tax=Elsinoe ampelina TaxID=302913 RepID=A0A6A6FZZ2_9PEZI|nr:BRE1 E3 ubiquitin ligase-domain-containing protein [Elsinoe ampelina]
MKSQTLETGAFPSALKLKMEDRKRTIVADHDDAGPPSKRQATAANGASRMDADKEKDVENYQKDAILRQMKEYKRNCKELESNVKDLKSQASYHDDHIRLIDAWFSQLLDEIHVLVSGAPVAEKGTSFQSSLLNESNPAFQEHLSGRSSKIREVINDIYSRIPQSSPEANELQERMSALLAAEKAHIVELQRVTAEKDALEDRLDAATERYLMAEKKLDRAKSAAVQKLEQQAVLKREDDTTKPEKAVKTEKVETNGEVDPAAANAAESARREAVAAAEKRKLQVEQLEAENKRLTDDLTAARMKAASVSDDDYAKTSLFTIAKSQLEDTITRLNDLKATNSQLQDDIKRLQAERTSSRTQAEEESRNTISENESLLARSESDLARIRNNRDALNAEVEILKGTHTTSQEAMSAAKELAEARELRIKALETELESIRRQAEGSQPMSTEDVERLGVDELRSKLLKLQSEYQELSDQTKPIEAAWRKTSTVANKKVFDQLNVEDKLARLSAEKAKADQKYFAAMKTAEARLLEIGVLKTQKDKTSGVVTQFKETEASLKQVLANLEKEHSETKDGLARMESQNRNLQQKISEADVNLQTSKTEASELKILLTSKDESTTKAANERRKMEVEVAEIKAKLEDQKKLNDTLKKRVTNGDGTAADDWRRMGICPVCNANLRNTALKLCGHVFCNVCIQNLITNRSRKCPTCSKNFGNNDSMPVHLA